MTVDLSELLVFSISPLELIARGTMMYWFIFILLRVAGRRDLGSFGTADLIVIVLIADAASNAMQGDYKSVTDGFVLIGTLVFWSVVIDRIGYYSPRARQWLEPSVICLIRDGQIQRRGLRREYVTEEELMTELRSKGIEDVAEVRRCYMEQDGRVSVIPYQKKR